MSAMRTLLLGLCAALAMTSVASPESLTDKVVAMTPEHFRDTATIRDDDLDVAATISTEKARPIHGGFLHLVYDQNFIRAMVDKKTGIARYQIYQVIQYLGDWHNYETVNYEAPGGPKQEPLTVISRDVVSCGQTLGCFVRETFGFDVEETLLRRIASKYTPGARVAWKFKYTAHDGSTWQDGIVPAEIAGALEAVDKYRAARGLPTPDLGVPTN